MILTGLPASGKSTLSNLLKNLLEEKEKFKIKIIDPDNIRKKLMGNEFKPELEKEVRKANLKNVRKYLKEGAIVISDDLNYYTSMRHDLKEIAEDLNLPYYIIFISTPMAICIEWNKNRGEPIPKKIIEDIEKKFDYFDKYEWEIPDIEFDLSKVKKNSELREKVSEIYEYIYKQNIKPSKREEINKIINLKQKIDIITRNVVGEILSKPQNLDKKEILLGLRKKFIQKPIEKDIKDFEIENSFKNYILKNSRIEV